MTGYVSEDDDSERACEIDSCNKVGTTIEQDELGNDCWVCEDHAEMLAARSPERQADEWYDQTHRSGEE